MSLCVIRPYREGDEHVTFREDDEREIYAAGRTTCAQMVAKAAKDGVVEVAVDTVGTPVAFFGAVPVTAGAAAVWMVATDGIVRNARSVAVLAPAWIAKQHARFPVLFNYVDARNDLHIRWLKRLGFVFINLHPAMGAERLPFYEFVRIP